MKTSVRILYGFYLSLEQLFTNVVYDKVYLRTAELSDEYKRRVIEKYDEIEHQVMSTIKDPLNPFCWIGLTLSEIADYFDSEDNIREEEFHALTYSLQKIQHFLNGLDQYTHNLIDIS